MTKIQFQCPENDLAELVRRLEPVVFESITQVDGVKGIRSKLKEVSPGTPENQLGLIAELIDKVDSGEDIHYYDMLQQYGITREEMVRNLGDHVGSHAICRNAYDVFLLKESFMFIYTAKKLALPGSSELEIEEVRKKLDRESYLRIGV